MRSTIELAHSLNLVATADGIEDEDTLALLKQYRCDFAQGFYLCRPEPAETIQRWVDAQRVDLSADVITMWP